MPDGYPPLPPGLTPVQAGRLGLWLLGKRKHLRAQRRNYHANRALRGNRQHLARRWVGLVCRWSVDEYPGWIRGFASALGLNYPTAKTTLYRSDRTLPVRHAVRLLELGRQYEAEWRALNADLEAYVAEKTAPKARKRRGGKTG